MIVDTNLLENRSVQSFPIDCPACSCNRAKHAVIEGIEADHIFVCLDCGAIFGKATRVTMRRFVDTAHWNHTLNDPPVRYFDFDVLEDDGYHTRVHGWFNPDNGKVVQFG